MMPTKGDQHVANTWEDLVRRDQRTDLSQNIWGPRQDIWDLGKAIDLGYLPPTNRGPLTASPDWRATYRPGSPWCTTSATATGPTSSSTSAARPVPVASVAEREHEPPPRVGRSGWPMSTRGGR